MKKIVFIICSLLAIVQLGCNKMDSTYSGFLKDGPIIYSERLDSVKVFSGRNRVLLTWRPITDPRVTKIKVSWGNEGATKDIPVTGLKDTSAIIDGLSEGNYVLNFLTYDGNGNHSVKTEVLASVYDTLYEKGLVLRDISSVSLNGTNLAVTFKSMLGVASYDRQEIIYTSSSDGQLKSAFLPASETVITINDFSGQSFTHKSVYKPQPLSPDNFYSASKLIYTPANPLPAYPAAGLTGVSCAPEFAWYNSVLMATATYRVQYSTDQVNWTTVTATQNQVLQLQELLLPNTRYYWRVTATSGTTTRTSDIVSFTAGAKDLYANGEAVKIQSNTTNATPVKLVFTGDGFQQPDFFYDGSFDRYVNEAVEAFFSVEPYKSYRQYFEVWKVAAYSTDAGVSESDKSVTLNTVFQSNFTGTTITSNTTNIYTYAKKVPGVTDAALSNLSVVVLLNRKRQGGASYVTNDKRNIALVPVYKSAAANVYTSLKDVVIKQAGGFCFGLLADESNTKTGTLSATEITQLQAEWAAGRSLNVDLNGAVSSVRWSHFIGKTGYSRPAIYEGAYGFRAGVFRSEESSCMVNGINYFNAISRELIVKRILNIAGETYNLDKFIEKDIAKAPYL